jgi:hypothetical protein
MLSDGSATVPALALNTGSVSVSGANATLPAAPAAFTLFHTPPPVVPTYTVLPVASAGSIANAVTRPVTNPKLWLAICAGPSASHAALNEPAVLGLAISALAFAL